MTTANRADILRARFKAIGGLPYPRVKKLATSALKPSTGPKPRATRRQEPFFGVSLYERRTQWVGKPNGLSADLLPQRKRREDQSPLIRISRQFPRKLMRVPIE